MSSHSLGIIVSCKTSRGSNLCNGNFIGDDYYEDHEEEEEVEGGDNVDHSQITPGQVSPQLLNNAQSPQSEINNRSIYHTILSAIENKMRSVTIEGKIFKLDFKGKAHGICGPMKSCKTDELIRELVRVQLGGSKVSASKPKIDTRSATIQSRTGATWENVFLFDDVLGDDHMRECIKYEEIGMDEAHFVKDMEGFIVAMTAIGINLHIVYLNGTFEMKGFENVHDFEACLCSKTWYPAVCANCPYGKNVPAPFSHLEKIPTEAIKDFVHVGDQQYVSLCRACYMDRTTAVIGRLVRKSRQ